MWSDWSPCSGLCIRTHSNGTLVQPNMFRTKKIQQAGNDQGRSCQDLRVKEEKNCNIRHCPADGTWSEGSEFSPCSAKCGPGEKTRSRYCKGPFYGGKECPKEQAKQSLKCNVTQCKGRRRDMHASMHRCARPTEVESDFLIPTAMFVDFLQDFAEVIHQLRFFSSC